MASSLESSTWDISEKLPGISVKEITMSDQELYRKSALADLEGQTEQKVPQEPEWKPQKSEKIVMYSLAFISLMCALDATILVTVLPTLAVDLHGTATDAFWAGTSYLLTCAVFQPFIAALAEIFGPRWPLLGSLIFFTIGSVICAVANNFPTLLVGRCLQGVGGGGIISLTQFVFANVVPLKQRPQYFNIVLAAWGVGTVLGPFIGALFTEKSTWRWCFFINLPFCGIGLGLVFVFLNSETNIWKRMSHRIKSVDWIGGFLFIGSLTSFLIGLSWAGVQYSWYSVHTLVPLIVGASGIIVALVYEKLIPGIRTEDEVEERKFRHNKCSISSPEKKEINPLAFTEDDRKLMPWTDWRKYTGNPFFLHSLFHDISSCAAYFCAVLQGLVLFCGLYYITFYFSAVKLNSPIHASIPLFPITATLLPGSAVVSRLLSLDKKITLFGKTTKVGGHYRAAIWIGWAISALGCGLLIRLDQYTSTAQWAGYFIVIGLGSGVVLSSLNFGTQALCREGRDAGRAASMYAFCRTLGMTIGVAVGGTTFQNLMSHKLKQLGIDTSIAKNAEGYIQVMLKQTPEQRAKPIAAYLHGLRGIYIVMTAAACAAFLLSLLIKHKSMDRRLVSSFYVEAPGSNRQSRVSHMDKRITSNRNSAMVSDPPS